MAWFSGPVRQAGPVAARRLRVPREVDYENSRALMRKYFRLGEGSWRGSSTPSAQFPRGSSMLKDIRKMRNEFAAGRACFEVAAGLLGDAGLHGHAVVLQRWMQEDGSQPSERVAYAVLRAAAVVGAKDVAVEQWELMDRLRVRRGGDAFGLMMLAYARWARTRENGQRIPPERVAAEASDEIVALMDTMRRERVPVTEYHYAKLLATCDNVERGLELIDWMRRLRVAVSGESYCALLGGVRDASDCTDTELAESAGRIQAAIDTSGVVLTPRQTCRFLLPASVEGLDKVLELWERVREQACDGHSGNVAFFVAACTHAARRDSECVGRAVEAAEAAFRVALPHLRSDQRPVFRLLELYELARQPDKAESLVSLVQHRNLPVSNEVLRLCARVTGREEMQPGADQNRVWTPGDAQLGAEYSAHYSQGEDDRLLGR
eukprot:TRINITY_DN21608_c0_g1_i1.p1 TRINITY_DN21608_c0_g1~~TRINITY_DN21608_c0_g1_i1.p1  ORF type:complete len:435 (+),score=149.17 TRINITY_DN21608_c0_g1_i1:73-1377(+)